MVSVESSSNEYELVPSIPIAEDEQDTELPRETLIRLIEAILRDGLCLWFGAPVFAGCAVPFITCHTGIPKVAIIVFAVPVVASLWVEVKWIQSIQHLNWKVQVISFPEASQLISIGEIFQRMSATVSLVLPDVLSTLAAMEMTDVLTDYLFPVVAWSCNARVVALWKKSWDEAAWPIGPVGLIVADTLGFWGVAVIFVVIFVVVLQGVRSAVGTWKLLQDAKTGQPIDAPRIYLAAEWAGHLVISELFEGISDQIITAIEGILSNMESFIVEMEQEQQQLDQEIADAKINFERDKERLHMEIVGKEAKAYQSVVDQSERVLKENALLKGTPGPTADWQDFLKRREDYMARERETVDERRKQLEDAKSSFKQALQELEHRAGMLAKRLVDARERCGQGRQEVQEQKDRGDGEN